MSFVKKACQLKLPLFDESCDTVNYGIVFILGRFEFSVETYSEKFSETLPEYSTRTTEKGFDNMKRCLVCLSLDKLYKHIGLMARKFF